MGTDDKRIQGKPARQPAEYLAVGRVIRPHGIRGALKVIALSELVRTLEPAVRVFLGEGKIQAVVRAFRRHGKDFLLFLEGCETRTEAERFRDCIVHVLLEDTEPLADGVFYYWQILGLQVISRDGSYLGEVVEILETGANDVYIVRNESGQEFLVPAIASVILEVDLENSQLIIDLLPGLIP